MIRQRSLVVDRRAGRSGTGLIHRRLGALAGTLALLVALPSVVLPTAALASARQAGAHHVSGSHRPSSHVYAHTSRWVALHVAPALGVRRNTLRWWQIAGAHTYVLAVTVGRDRRQTRYRIVRGTHLRPRAVPGRHVHYGVRVAVPGARWSREVTIAYAALKKPQPASAPAPAPSTAASTVPFVKGMVMGLGGWGAQAPQVAGEGVAAGATWDREDLSWASVEPAPGVFNWSSFDNVIAVAKAKGLTVLPVMGYVPSWSSVDDTAGYAAFVRAAVQRYGPGTSANLSWFELWNEPYFNYTMPGGSNAAKYARLYDAAAIAAKQVNPGARLLIAADTAPTEGGSNWIDAMFSAVPDIGQYVDGISVHPYGADPSIPTSQSNWSFQRVDDIRAKFLAHGVDKPEWITEVGWSTYSVSEVQQASYYADLFTQIRSRLSFIRAVFPYCLREFSNNYSTNQPQFGLEHFGSWTPKPALGVVQSAYSTL